MNNVMKTSRKRSTLALLEGLRLWKDPETGETMVITAQGSPYVCGLRLKLLDAGHRDSGTHLKTVSTTHSIRESKESPVRVAINDGRFDSAVAIG